MVKAAQGGLGEVALGQLAQSHGSSAGAKQFGKRMVTDHTKANAQLKQVAAEQGRHPARRPRPRRAGDQKRVSRACPDRRSTKPTSATWLRTMSKMSPTSKKKPTTGKDPAVKAFAAKTLPTLADAPPDGPRAPQRHEASIERKSMKAVVWHGIGDIRLDDVPKPKIQDPTDAIVRLTASAICGTDLHFVRGTFAGMKPGTILGHEGVGVVEEVGKDVRNFNIGDRVVIGSTLACGTARTAAPATIPNATRPTRTVPRRARRSSAARFRRAGSTACRPSTPASPSPMSPWSSCPMR